MLRAPLVLGAVALSGLAVTAHAEAAQARPIGVTPAPLVRPLDVGAYGLDVYVMERALQRAHVRPASRKPSRRFGAATRYEVRRLQRAHAIDATGHVGHVTWRLLAPLVTVQGRIDLDGVQAHRKAEAKARARAEARKAAQARAARLAAASYAGRVLAAVKDAELHSWEMAYSQSWSRADLPAFPAVPLATDCSGWAIWVQRHAGIDLPMGWTGTLGVEGWRVASPSTSTLRVGDLVFYGPFPHSHVEVYIGGGLTAGHGSPGIHVRPWNSDYRGVGQVRRYHA